MRKIDPLPASGSPASWIVEKKSRIHGAFCTMTGNEITTCGRPLVFVTGPLSCAKAKSIDGGGASSVSCDKEGSARAARASNVQLNLNFITPD